MLSAKNEAKKIHKLDRWIAAWIGSFTCLIDYDGSDTCGQIAKLGELSLEWNKLECRSVRRMQGGTEVRRPGEAMWRDEIVK